MLTLRLNVNSSCNLRCKHCYYISKVGFDGKEMLLKKAKDIVDQVYNIYGNNANIVVMGGGEPMIYKPLFKLLDYISGKKGMISSITTNSMLITQDDLLKFKQTNTLLAISIEGKQNYNDSIRGKGVFKKVLKTAIKAKKIGVRIVLNLTINKNNLLDIPYIIKTFNSYVEYITFSRYIPYTKTSLAEELTKKDYLVLEKILKKYNKQGFRSRQENFFRRNKGKLKNKYLFSINSIGSLYILPDMTLYPAWDLIDYKLGNLNDEKLIDILNNGKLEKLYNPDNLEGKFCYRCKYKYNCGGDRGVAYFYTGDFWGDDIQCPYFNEDNKTIF